MQYHNITAEDMNNGDGLRTVLWVAGCEHHCKECQNPVTWDKNGGILFDNAAKNELLESLSPDYIAGVTLSGGDPLASYNRFKVLEIIREIKKAFPEKTIWVYSGYTFEELIKQAQCVADPWISKILENIDVLVDGRYEKNRRNVTLKWRGSSNQRVINIKESLKTGTISLHCS